MWMKDEPAESAKQRHNRILSAQTIKAHILAVRVNNFIDNINKSDFYSDPEKKQILSQFKIIKTS